MHSHAYTKTLKALHTQAESPVLVKVDELKTFSLKSKWSLQIYEIVVHTYDNKNKYNYDFIYFSQRRYLRYN